MVDIPYENFAVREFLDTKPILFTSDYGNMPVNRERRYFVRDGKVEFHHPYWPPSAVEEGKPTLDNWQEFLEDINRETPEEIIELTKLSEKIGKLFEHAYWSVDWLWVNDKWYLTDMAIGERSYKWEKYTY